MTGIIIDKEALVTHISQGYYVISVAAEGPSFGLVPNT